MEVCSTTPLKLEEKIPSSFHQNTISATRSRLACGAKFTLAGKSYHLFPFSKEAVSLEPIPSLSLREEKAVVGFINFTKERLAPIVEQIANRLADPFDGLIASSAHTIAPFLGTLEDSTFQRVAPYFLFLAKKGTNYNTSRGCVIPPPISLEELEELLKVVPSQAFPPAERTQFLNAIYSSTPSITEGFYLFKTREDQSRFERSLGDEYAVLCQEVAVLFERATKEDLTQDEWKSYYSKSEALGKKQSDVLTPLLQKESRAEEMTTRIWISVSETGDISFESKHYQNAFAGELFELSYRLQLAQAYIPERFTAFKELLETYELWAKEENEDPAWGQTLNSWVNFSDSSFGLDLNITCEEKMSALGNKSFPHLALNQFVQPHKEIASLWELLVKEGRSKGVETVLFRTLLGGGMFSHHTIMGEKLPDPAGLPLYKSQTFGNSTLAACLLSQADAIAEALLHPDKKTLIATMKDIPIIAVALHEYGHTLGGRESRLGNFAGSIEEVNAQASVPYLAARLKLSNLSDLLQFESCWTPVSRAQQGPNDPHSHSDLLLFDEYLRSGSIQVVKVEGKKTIQIVDAKLLSSTAFSVACKIRLWELGIPLAQQSQFVESFDVEDSDQDQRIVQRSMAWLKERSDHDGLFNEAIGEVNQYCDASKIQKIHAVLEPIVQRLSVGDSFLVMPNNSALETLCGED